jgi:hypothetical protein
LHWIDPAGPCQCRVAGGRGALRSHCRRSVLQLEPPTEMVQKLVASIRGDEERMLKRIMLEIPKLTDAVVRAEIEDHPSDGIPAFSASLGFAPTAPWNPAPSRSSCAVANTRSTSRSPVHSPAAQRGARPRLPRIRECRCQRRDTRTRSDAGPREPPEGGSRRTSVAARRILPPPALGRQAWCIVVPWQPCRTCWPSGVGSREFTSSRRGGGSWGVGRAARAGVRSAS